MNKMKTIVAALALAIVGASGVQAAESGTRNTLKDGSTYEKKLEQAGMSGMSGMSGNQSSTAAPDKKIAKAKAKVKKAEKQEAAPASDKAAK